MKPSVNKISRSLIENHLPDLFPLIFVPTPVTVSLQPTWYSGHGPIYENGEILAEREPFSEKANLLISEIDTGRLCMTDAEKVFNHCPNLKTTLLSISLSTATDGSYAEISDSLLFCEQGRQERVL